MKIVHVLFMLLISINTFSDSIYNRKEWQSNWPDEDKDCQNTRAEILIERSLEEVLFTSKKKCNVFSGKWRDYYFPGFLFKAKEVDIDHLVPLYEAHKSGGSSWSKKEKRRFANDTENLVITSRITNRKKGANNLRSWLPLHFNYACRYYRQWMYIKKKYNLKITQEEVMAIDSEKCTDEIIKSI